MKISKKREAVKTPLKLINEDGTPNFGTFRCPFIDFNLINFKSNSPLRRFYNKFRLTEWEAVEVISNKGVFLSAIYKFGVMDINLTMFYEVSSDKLYIWNNMDILLNRSHVSKNLFDGNKSIYQTKKSKTVIINNYASGFAKCNGFSKNKKADVIEFDFDLKNISKPSIVSIPVKGVYPVYTEKDLFSFKGSIKVNGIEMFDDPNALAIIDDHRGYYPRKSGYDWLTTFGYKNINKKSVPFGLNITDFRLNKDQFDYNENGYWNNKDFNVLPNAKFVVINNEKHITDEFGDIDLVYKTSKTHTISFNVFLFRIEYKLCVGRLNGYIKDLSGQKIEFVDDLSLSEYRYTII